MTAGGPEATTPPRALGRSAGALAAGFLTVFVLSLGTDQLLHVLRVYPPWGKPMFEPGLNLLALSYRVVYTILGGVVAAWLAPNRPMRHAGILGFIGLFFGTVGVIATLPLHLGPAWYPISIASTAFPCAWLGGTLHRSWQAAPGPR